MNLRRELKVDTLVVRIQVEILLQYQVVSAPSNALDSGSADGLVSVNSRRVQCVYKMLYNAAAALLTGCSVLP